MRSSSEEQCAQHADIDVNGHMLHVYNVHLDTAILERRSQAERLAAIVSDRHVGGAKLVFGDRGSSSSFISITSFGVAP